MMLPVTDLEPVLGLNTKLSIIELSENVRNENFKMSVVSFDTMQGHAF